MRVLTLALAILLSDLAPSRAQERTTELRAHHVSRARVGAARRQKVRLRRALTRERRAVAALLLRRQLELDLLHDSLAIRHRRAESRCTLGWDRARFERELGPLREAAAELRRRFATYQAELREAELRARRRLRIPPRGPS